MNFIFYLPNTCSIHLKKRISKLWLLKANIFSIISIFYYEIIVILKICFMIVEFNIVGDKKSAKECRIKNIPFFKG